MANDADSQWMRGALMLAQRGDGLTAPNPAVGCVLVKDGNLIGRGTTARGGRPHAEPQAIASAGGEANGSTAYVTLEPCAHHGKTPPCAETLVKAGVARVVIGLTDPDERVSGQGIKILEKAGIPTTQGVLADAITRQLAGYLMTRTEARPYVSAKIATTLDGRIALKNGHSQWITSALAKRYTHDLRSRHDAILTGMGTIRKDDPLLTCRLEGVTHQPLRVVMASKPRLDGKYKLAKSAKQHPVLVFYGSKKGASATSSTINYRLIKSDKTGRPCPRQALSILAKQGMTNILLEAGGTLLASFFEAGLIDRLIWLRAGMIIGGDGRDAVGALGLTDLEAGRGFRLYEQRVLGQDTLEIWERET